MVTTRRSERRADGADDARPSNRRRRPGGGGKVGRAGARTRWVSAPSCPGVAGAGPGRSKAGRPGSVSAVRPKRRRATARCAPGSRGLANTRPAASRPTPGERSGRRPALSSTGMGTALCRRSSANSAAVHRRCGSATNAGSRTAATGGGSTANRLGRWPRSPAAASARISAVVVPRHTGEPVSAAWRPRRA